MSSLADTPPPSAPESVVVPEAAPEETLNTMSSRQVAVDIKVIQRCTKLFFDNEYIRANVFGVRDDNRPQRPMLYEADPLKMFYKMSFPTMLHMVASHPLPPPRELHLQRRYEDLLRQQEVLNIRARRPNACCQEMERKDVANGFERIRIMHEVHTKRVQDAVHDTLCLYAIECSDASDALAAEMENPELSADDLLARWREEIRRRSLVYGSQS